MKALAIVVLAAGVVIGPMNLIPWRFSRFVVPASTVAAGVIIILAALWSRSGTPSPGSWTFTVIMIALGGWLAFRAARAPERTTGPVPDENGVLHGLATFRDGHIKKTTGVLELDSSRIRFRTSTEECRFDFALDELQDLKVGSGGLRFANNGRRYTVAFMGTTSRDLGGVRRARKAWQKAIAERQAAAETMA